MSPYPDPTGKILTDYVRPSVTVDTAVLTVDQGRLMVALVHSDGTLLRLPGSFLREGETLADAVRRSLFEKLQISGLSPRQLHVFDALGRDARGWVLSVAHIAVVPREQLGNVHLTPVEQATYLAFDHDRMLTMALTELRAEYAEHPDPSELLERFTLRDLRLLHEAIDPDTLMRDSFRRLMEPQLIDTGVMTSGTVGKPSRVFRRATVAEKLKREFSGPPSTSARSSSTRGTASRASSSRRGSFDGLSSETSSLRPADFAVEVAWNNGEIDQRPQLTLAEAERIFAGFVTKLTEARDRFTPEDSPRKIRIAAPDGSTLEQHRFSANATRGLIPPMDLIEFLNRPSGGC
jgi:8-oxo-dGTP diphosphatase